MLTKKQKNLLLFINKKLRASGVSPSYEEMKDSLNLKSKSGIHRLISALEERGFIRRLPHKARALEFKEALIGVNNRNLKTLKTDKKTTYSINNALKNFNGPLISESGIKTKEELLEISKNTNIKTFLIGESLLKNLEKNSIFSVL